MEGTPAASKAGSEVNRRINACGNKNRHSHTAAVYPTQTALMN